VKRAATAGGGCATAARPANSAVSPREFELISGYIEKECGIVLSAEKTYLVETRLAKLVAQSGCETFEEFYHLAKRGTDAKLRERIIDAITTNETLWFRDRHPFTILRDVILPELAARIVGGKQAKARIWSAASSTGQEPYSIAMTVLEYCRRDTRVRPEQFEIVATDISQSVLFVAKAGRYDSFAAERGLPADMRERYMVRDGQVYCVKDEVKQLVKFQRFNLQDSPASLGRFDCVFLRYVAIYFSQAFIRNLIGGIASASNRPGYLIVGAVETLRGVSEEYEARRHDDGYYYQCGAK
jgi:chemotaxis protein methyltransferase CheR